MAASRFPQNFDSVEVERIVWVEVVDDNSVKPYIIEVLLETNINAGLNDLNYIVSVMIQKKPALAPILKSGAYQFQIESKYRAGKWIQVDEELAIKNGSELRCFILKCQTFEFDSPSLMSKNITSVEETQNLNSQSSSIQENEEQYSRTTNDSDEEEELNQSTSGKVVNPRMRL